MGGNSFSQAAGTAFLGASSLGLKSLSLLDNKKSANHQLNNISANAAYKIGKRRNLLEQQLASRRAQLGSLGLTGSSSAAAVEQRLAGEAFDDVNQIQSNSAAQRRRIKDDYQSNLLGSISSVAAKLIR